MSGIIVGCIAHLAYIAGPEVPELWCTPMLRAAGWLLLAVGPTLWLRAVASVGIGTLVLLYVYIPEDGRMASSSIYALIRRPDYAATLNIGAGLALIHANWYALLVLPVLYLFFFAWIRLVEEPDLVVRYPGYLEYRKRVPHSCRGHVTSPGF